MNESDLSLLCAVLVLPSIRDTVRMKGELHGGWSFWSTLEGPGVPPDQVRQGLHHEVLRLRRGDGLPAAGHGWQWEAEIPRILHFF